MGLDTREEFEGYPWRLDTTTTNRPRAFAWVPRKKPGKGSRKLFLEKLITKVGFKGFVRFRNGNTLDCRRANLERVANEWEITEGQRGCPISGQSRRKSLGG